MKRFLLALLGLAIVLSGCSGPVGQPDAAVRQLIVSFEDDIGDQASGSVPSKALAAQGSGAFRIVDSLTDQASSKSVLPSDPAFMARLIAKMGHVYTYEYDPKAFASEEEAIRALRDQLSDQGLRVRYVEPNELLYATAMNPSQEWHYNMIHAPEAWTVTGGSSSTVIAVLDTGVDLTHSSLRNYIDTARAKTYYGSSVQDGNGHGTHCSGTIASYGSVSGVMQVATIVPVKVLSDEGSGATSYIAAAITYAANIGADVISMSLGGGSYNTTMADACAFAISEGTVIVAASGNENASSISYPAAYDGVISVAAVDSTGTRASFSNYGAGLDVSAPGVNIYSTWKGNSFNTISGTSMATPHVAGVVGLMRSVNPDITVAQVEQILESTATYAGSATYYGSGIVNAYQAVLAADDDVDPPDPDEYSTSTDITTDKATYAPGETVNITVTVKDQDNLVLSGAAVQVTLTTPSGSTASGSGTTNASGQVTLTYTTSSTSATGTYSLSASASKSGYLASSDSATFKLQSATTIGTRTTVTTSRTYYYRGNTAYITATVRRSDNYAALAGATVAFRVTRPDGYYYTGTGITGSTGSVTLSFYTLSTWPTGSYTVNATTTMSGYTGSTASTYFRLY